MEDQEVVSNPDFLTKGNKIFITIRDISWTCDKNTYRDEYLSGILTRKEFDKILDNSDKCIGRAMQRKRDNDEVRLPKSFTYLSAIAVLLSLAYVFLTFMGGLSSQSSTASTTNSTNTTSATDTSNTETKGMLYTIMSVVCLIGATFIITILSIYNNCRKSNTFKTIDYFMKDEVDKYYDMVNQKYINILEFEYNQSCKIVELSIYKKSQTIINHELKEKTSSLKKRSLIDKDSVASSRIDISRDDLSSNVRLNPDSSVIDGSERASINKSNFEMDHSMVSSQITPNAKKKVMKTFGKKK